MDGILSNLTKPASRTGTLVKTSNFIYRELDEGDPQYIQQLVSGHFCTLELDFWLSFYGRHLVESYQTRFPLFGSDNDLTSTEDLNTYNKHMIELYGCEMKTFGVTEDDIIAFSVTMDENLYVPPPPPPDENVEDIRPPALSSPPPPGPPRELR